MLISAKGIHKKYAGNVLFSELNLEIPFQTKLAITGPNGSGKTTLLQILAGLSLPTQGKVIYFSQNAELDSDIWYTKFSFCSAYQELLEEYTASEIANFHFSLKPISKNLTVSSFLELVRLDKEKSKPVKFYSTGMKQRLKLGLAFCTDAPILFLDEPTSNLDKANFNWYLEMIQQYTPQKTVIISSNIPEEYTFCTQTVDIMSYK